MRANDEVDCVVGGYRELDLDGSIIYSLEQDFYDALDYKSALLDLYLPSYWKFNGFLWNRLFRRSIIVDNNLKFKEGIFYREDGLFITEFLCCSKKPVVYILNAVYNYYINPVGAMGTVRLRCADKFLTELDSRILSLQTILRETTLFDFKLRYKAFSSVIDAGDCISSLIREYAPTEMDKLKTIYRKVIDNVSYPLYYIYRDSLEIDLKI